jgi:hypothetical protein
MSHKFTCAACHGTFVSESSDEERIAEYEKLFAQPIDAEPTEVVCDDCWKAMGCDRIGADIA